MNPAAPRSERSERSAVSVFWLALEAIMASCFLAMLMVMFVQVFSRYALGIGVPWTDETSRFLFIGEIFLGAAIAQRYGAQIRITVLLDVLGRKVRNVLEAVSDLLTALVAVGIAYGAVQMAGRAGNVSASTIPISFSVLYYVQAVGLFLLASIVLRDLVIRMRRVPSAEAPQ